MTAIVALRVADLLAGLSRLADVGFGMQPGEALRSCALTTRLGRWLNLSDADMEAAFYTALLHHVGCTGYAHETARVFGDELRLNAASGRTDLADPRDLFTTFLPLLTSGHSGAQRARPTVTALVRGNRFGKRFTVAACEVGRAAARRLRLPAAVQDSVYSVYELWEGGGEPAGLSGDDIPVGSRLARLTGIAVLFDTIGGAAYAVDAVRRRSGGMLDPQMATCFVERGEALLAEVNATDPVTMVLDAEPAPPLSVSEPRLPGFASVFADLADLKSPYTHGHSRGVAALARRAGAELGLSERGVGDLEVAALLHDVGRVAISDTVWEKGGALDAAEWEQVRLHAYHSERILAGSPRLASLGALVGRHHERLDGSGYHRGCSATDLPMPARVLAAADGYQAMTQRRAHRPPLTPKEAAGNLLTEVRAGRLDPDAVSAVLSATGLDPAVPSPPRPAGLSDREVEVLGLVADGCSNAEIADRLVISRRTAEHHVQHIYTKIGVSSRAAAALFAMEHGLLSSGGR